MQWRRSENEVKRRGQFHTWNTNVE